MIGLVGGLGPESTIDYYRSIVRRYGEENEGRSPSLMIVSLDVRKTLAFIASGELDVLRDYLLGAILSLARAGAKIAAITANSPHVVFDEVRARSPIPLVSVVEAARDATVGRGFRKVVLIGTEYTMNGRFYPDVFEASGLSLVTPSAEEKAFIHEKYVGELLAGNFKTQTRNEITQIIADVARRHAVDGAILAGTELPMLFARGAPLPIPILDTTRIHVGAILDWFGLRRLSTDSVGVSLGPNDAR